MEHGLSEHQSTFDELIQPGLRRISVKSSFYVTSKMLGGALLFRLSRSRVAPLIAGNFIITTGARRASACAHFVDQPDAGDFRPRGLLSCFRIHRSVVFYGREPPGSVWPRCDRPMLPIRFGNEPRLSSFTERAKPAPGTLPCNHDERIPFRQKVLRDG